MTYQMRRLLPFELQRCFCLARQLHPEPEDLIFRRGTRAWDAYFETWVWIDGECGETDDFQVISHYQFLRSLGRHLRGLLHDAHQTITTARL